MTCSAFSERRGFVRYALKNSVYTANCCRPGLVVDISMGGLAVRYLDRKRWADNAQETYQLDLVDDDGGGYIPCLPIRIITDCPAANEYSGNAMVFRRRGMQFEPLTPQQLAALTDFIALNTIDAGASEKITVSVT